VEAFDSSGNNEGFSTRATAVTQAVALTAPGSLAATAVSNVEIDLSWTSATAAAGITGYLVERCQGTNCTTFSQIATSAATSYRDVGLPASTVYGYRVRATDGAGNLSGYSNAATATTLAALNAPTGLSLGTASATQVGLAWNAATGLATPTAYLIERCQGQNCSNFAEIATSATTSYTDTGVLAETSYTYRIRATDAASDLSAYSTTLGVTTQSSEDAQTPTVPGGLTATAASGYEIDLTWTASTDEVGIANYVLERCMGTGCTTFTQIATLAATSFRDTGLALASSYSYQIQAVDVAGNPSGYSSAVTATTSGTADTQPPTVPSGLTALAASGSAITLAWTASSDNIGATGYLIEQCQGVGCSNFSQIALVAAADTYRIRATDAAGNLSGYSNTASASTAASGTICD
jgi:chitodextrinase